MTTPETDKTILDQINRMIARARPEQTKRLLHDIRAVSVKPIISESRHGA